MTTFVLVGVWRHHGGTRETGKWRTEGGLWECWKIQNLYDFSVVKLVGIYHCVGNPRAKRSSRSVWASRWQGETKTDAEQSKMLKDANNFPHLNVCVNKRSRFFKLHLNLNKHSFNHQSQRRHIEVPEKTSPVTKCIFSKGREGRAGFSGLPGPIVSMNGWTLSLFLDDDHWTNPILLHVFVLFACRERWENLEREGKMENLVFRFLWGYTHYSA